VTAEVSRGIRTAIVGLGVNAALAVVKIVAGIAGHSQALIADGIESTADVFSSLVVWSGLRISTRAASEEYPFGYGKAEPLATAVVSLLILSAAAGIAVQAVRHILTPHVAPAAWTLVVLVVVVAVKWLLSRRVHAVATEIDSGAVKADAWHHMSDAFTSAAAFVGISVALWGGPGWEAADDWAALLASGVIAFNGVSMLRPALNDLMDRMPGPEIVDPVRRAAQAVPGVLATEKLFVRRSGVGYRVTIHVQAEPTTSLHDAHVLGGKVKSAIRAAVPAVQYVLVHMEPYER